jgi:hypothetical protein
MMRAGVKDPDVELELFIERRGRDLQPDDEEHDPRWQRSVAEYAGQLREANRSAWREHHLNLAALHTRLAEEHRAEAVKLAGRQQ